MQTPSHVVRPRSLLSQVVAVNSLLVAATVLLATLAVDFELSSLRGPRELLVLGLAVLGTLLGNALLLRRRFVPLERLISAMETADLSRPRDRLPARGNGMAEVDRLRVAFDRMLGRLEAERRQAATAAVRAQERERQRLAQDLHDEVNQALTAILLRLEAASQDAPPALERELRETQRLANQAMEELLRLARHLRPAVLDDHGLLPALHAQVQDFGDQTGIAAEFRRRGAIPPLTPDQQLVVYRVTQESLSNVARHAGARHVEVELSFAGRTQLSVTDDGRGCAGGRPGGLGLSGMRERALMAGGDLHVHSPRGGGTRVELTVG